MADANGNHRVGYFAVFLALCGLTALSVVADLVEFNNTLLVIVIVLAVATAKALFVMLYFMHLKFEGNWKYLLLAPTIILATGIPLALMADIGLKYYLPDVPQMRDAPAAQHAEDEAPSAAHGEH